MRTVKKMSFQKETLCRLDQDPVNGPCNNTSDPCNTALHTNACSVGLHCTTC